LTLQRSTGKAWMTGKQPVRTWPAYYDILAPNIVFTSRYGHELARLSFAQTTAKRRTILLGAVDGDCSDTGYQSTYFLLTSFHAADGFFLQSLLEIVETNLTERNVTTI